MKCCLCGEEIEVQASGYDMGHNPEPLANLTLLEERCCGVCNDTKVIPARLKAALDSVRKT